MKNYFEYLHEHLKTIDKQKQKEPTNGRLFHSYILEKCYSNIFLMRLKKPSLVPF